MISKFLESQAADDSICRRINWLKCVHVLKVPIGQQRRQVSPTKLLQPENPSKVVMLSTAGHVRPVTNRRLLRLQRAGARRRRKFHSFDTTNKPLKKRPNRVTFGRPSAATALTEICCSQCVIAQPIKGHPFFFNLISMKRNHLIPLWKTQKRQNKFFFVSCRHTQTKHGLVGDDLTSYLRQRFSGSAFN